MATFNLNILIQQPITRVFEFISSYENNTQWQTGILQSAQTSSGPSGKGALLESVGHFIGYRIERSFEVTEYERNRKFGYKSIGGPFPMQTSYTFEMIGRGTQVNLITSVDPGDFFRLSDTVVTKKAKKQSKEDLNTLKDLLETKAR
jgi:hypothetical protein